MSPAMIYSPVLGAGGTGGIVTLGAAGAVAGRGVSSNCKPGAVGCGAGLGMLFPLGNVGGVPLASSWLMRLAKSGV